MYITKKVHKYLSNKSIHAYIMYGKIVGAFGKGTDLHTFEESGADHPLFRG